MIAPADPVLAPRELHWLAAAIALNLAILVVYVLAVRHLPLAGDQPEYDLEGQLISHGYMWWTRAPYGIYHAGAWKAPVYPAWVGLWYTLLGHHPLAVRLLQIPVGALTVPLGWLLARRLFGVRVAIAAALVLAVYPLAWQYAGLVYPEALATPLYVALSIVMLTRPPTLRRAVEFGLLLGVTLLLRPATVLFLPGLVIAWGLRAGWRRGLLRSAAAIATAVLVVAPWTIRNAVVMHGFLPISMEDAAAYGTFNSQSANDRLFPYVWLREPAMDAPLFDPRHPLDDLTLHSRLVDRAVTYIDHHPTSVLDAFFWNGLSRLWDIRHRSRSLVEVSYEGRSRLVTNLGLDAYDVLLPLCLIGLWRARRRRWLVLGILGVALGASVVFTVDSGTRYRAPLEPLIAVLACVGVLGPGPRMNPGTPHEPRPRMNPDPA